MGEIEYGGRYQRSQSGKESLASTRRINGLWRCPSIDINAKSRDCHAMDALEKAQRKLSGCASNLLTHEDLGHLRNPVIGIYKPSSITENSH